MNRVFTVNSLADSWQTTPEVIQELIDHGLLRTILIGLKEPAVRIHEADVETYLQQLRDQPSTLRRWSASSSEFAAPEELKPTAVKLPAVARLIISPDAQRGVDPKEFCFQHQIVGMGWPLDLPPGTLVDWAMYIQEATKLYTSGSWTPVIVFHDFPTGGCVWTRRGYGTASEFFIAKVIGEWEYRGDPDSLAADLENVRPCVWHRVGGYEYVHPTIPRSFTPKTFQRIKNPEAVAYTEQLAEQLVATGVWPA